MPQEAPSNILFVVALLLGLGVLSVLIFLPFSTAIVLGLLVVYLTYPVHRRLARLTGRPRIAASIVLLLFFVAVLVPTGWLAWRLFREAQAIAVGLTPEAVFATVDGTIRVFLGFVGVDPPADTSYARQLAEGAVPAAQGWLQANLPTLVGFVGAFFVGMFIVAFVVYYGLLDGPRLVAYVEGVLPLTRAQSRDLLAEIRRTVDAVFLGQIVGSVLQGILGALGFLLFGVPGVLVWGLVMTILAIIPVLGAFLIWAPAGLWLLAIGHTWQGVGLLLWGAIVVSNVDNVVKPLLVGSRARIHPVVVLVGVLGGLLVFGIMGFLLGPLVVSLFIAVMNFWRTDYLPAYRKSPWLEDLEGWLAEENARAAVPAALDDAGDRGG